MEVHRRRNKDDHLGRAAYLGNQAGLGGTNLNSLEGQGPTTCFRLKVDEANSPQRAWICASRTTRFVPICSLTVDISTRR